MRRKIFLFFLLLLAFSYIGRNSQKTPSLVPQVSAAQCWEPGCCGYDIVVNQYSCEVTTTRCRFPFEDGIQFDTCTSTGEQFMVEGECESVHPTEGPACPSPGTCVEESCPSGYAEECRLSQRSESCSHPDENTCTADVYEQQCNDDGAANNSTTCTVTQQGSPHVRQCWVNGSSGGGGTGTCNDACTNENASTVCTDGWWCNGGFCDNGSCNNSGSGTCGDSCPSGSTDCATGYWCDGNTCTNNSCAGTGTCNDSCSDNNDCASGYWCDGNTCTNNSCHGSGTCNDSCPAGSSDCAQGYWCSNGSCTNGSCGGTGTCGDSCPGGSSDCDTGAGYWCSNGECVNAGCNNTGTGTCNDSCPGGSADCASGYWCEGGSCTNGSCNGSGTCNDSCSGSNDCAAGYWCNGSTCTNGNCSGSGVCNDLCPGGTADCATGYWCNGSTCTNGNCGGSGTCDDTCGSNNDCASGYWCSSGECTNGSCSGTGTCGDLCPGGSSDCASGYWCSSGECTNGSCSGTGECGDACPGGTDDCNSAGGYWCSGGECTNGSCGGETCYGCQGTNQSGPYSSLADCSSSGSTDCTCSGTPSCDDGGEWYYCDPMCVYAGDESNVPVGKIKNNGSCPAECPITSDRPFYVFEDTDEDGVWDDGEKRISNDNSCMGDSGNSIHVSGWTMRWKDTWSSTWNTASPSCNMYNTEYPNSPCTWTSSCGVSNCSICGWECVDVNRTCFALHTCRTGDCGGFYDADGDPSNGNEAWGAHCSSATETIDGEACAGGFCGGNRDLRSGQVWMNSAAVGTAKDIGVDLPAGYRMSAGSSNDRRVFFNGSFGSCESPVGFGIVRDIDKTCTVQLSAGGISQGDSVTVTTIGSTTEIGDEPVRTWIAKTDFTQITPTPTGTTETVWGGKYYYEITASQFTVNNGSNGSTASYGSDLTTGQYYAWCDLPTNPSQCSGNPDCTYEGGSTDCSGWQSCHDGFSPTDNAILTVYCSPSCTPACGQYSGCPSYGYCADLCSGVVPDPPTNLQTTNSGSSFPFVAMNGTDLASFTWTAPINGGPSCTYSYDVLYYETGDPSYPTPQDAFDQEELKGSLAQADPSDGVVYVTAPSNGNIYDVGVSGSDTIGPNITVAIRAQNGCDPDKVSTWYQADITLVDEIAGEFKLTTDPTTETSDIGGICTETTSLPTVNVPNYNGNTSVEAESEETATVYTGSFAGSSYDIDASISPSGWSRGKHTVRLTISNDPSSPNALACACRPDGADPFTCEYVGVDSPINANFFLQEYDLSFEPWWYAAGGLLYAQGNLSSELPNLTPFTETYYLGQQTLLSAARSGEADSPGIPLSSSASISVGGNGGAFREVGTLDAFATSTDHSNTTEKNYEFFSRKIDLSDAAQATPITNGALPDKPAYAANQDDGTAVHYRDGDLVIDPTTTWSIGSAEKFLFFVSGDLTIQDSTSLEQLMEVSPGGFLGFIVGGDITFDASVGYTYNDTPGLEAVTEGLFLASGDLVIEGSSIDTQSDKKFIGEGTYVGWDDIIMTRDYDDTALGRQYNRQYPTDIFVYRPDFTVNIPDLLKDPKIIWQEQN